MLHNHFTDQIPYHIRELVYRDKIENLADLKYCALYKNTQTVVGHIEYKCTNPISGNVHYIISNWVKDENNRNKLIWLLRHEDYIEIKKDDL